MREAAWSAWVGITQTLKPHHGPMRGAGGHGAAAGAGINMALRQHHGRCGALVGKAQSAKRLLLALGGYRPPTGAKSEPGERHARAGWRADRVTLGLSRLCADKKGAACWCWVGGILETVLHPPLHRTSQK